MRDPSYLSHMGVSSLEEDDIRRLEKIRGIAHNLDFSRNSHKQKKKMFVFLIYVKYLCYLMFFGLNDSIESQIKFLLFYFKV